MRENTNTVSSIPIYQTNEFRNNPFSDLSATTNEATAAIDGRKADSLTANAFGHITSAATVPLPLRMSTTDVANVNRNYLLNMDDRYITDFRRCSFSARFLQVFFRIFLDGLRGSCKKFVRCEHYTIAAF